MRTEAETAAQKYPPRAWAWRLTVVCAAALILGLAGCGASTTSSKSKSTIDTPTMAMDFPDSLSGGTSSTALKRGASGDGPNCDYLGAGNKDPFQNGYFMTKFLVGAVATWTCVADFVSLTVASLKLPTDGTVITIGDGADNDPTGVSVTKESSDQTTVRLFYNGDEKNAGFYVSWVQTADGVDGRLILGSDVFQSDNPDDPTDMRMDFSTDSSGRTADMFIKFPDADSHHVNGFRIEVTRDDGAETFLSRGLIDFTGQWFSDTPDTITETPDLRIATLSNFAGTGAASAVFADAAAEFALGPAAGNRSLGWYLFDKDDRYFFDQDGGSDWINKQITSALYDSGKTSNGSDDSTIEGYLGVTTGEIAACEAAQGNPDDSCVDLLNAIFAVDSGLVTELNDDTTMPGGFRKTFINGLDYPDDYLDSPYPDGSDSWDGVFDMDFNP